MEWLKKFLIARKQRDSIKIMLLLMVAAFGFMAGAVYRGVTLYRFNNEPIEYVLTGESKRISELGGMPDLVSVSIQQENSRTLVYQGQEYPISCIALSEEYLSKVYKIQPQGVTETFYLNRPALRQMGTVDQELLVICLSEGMGGNGATSSQQLQTTVKLQLSEEIFDQEKPLVFLSAEAGRQQGFSANGGQMLSADRSEAQGNVQVRICFERQDFGGSQRKQIENIGFIVENQELHLKNEYYMTELLLRMRYEALLGALLMVGSICAFKYEK